jgi:hypothetical protein
MGFLQLLVSLWPFLKEMLTGERIKVTIPVPSVTGQIKQLIIEERRARNKNILSKCLDKMQQSKRFLGLVLILLSISLFINYKTISKISTRIKRNTNNSSRRSF